MDFNLTLIGQTIAMIVFVWFCMKYIWPPLMQALDERAKTIADGLAAAEKAGRDLAEAESEKQKILDEARGQAREIVDQANKRGTGIVEEARNEGRKERDRQVEAAQAEIQQEINAARDDLRRQVGAIALVSAEKIIGREIDAGTHEDLLSELASQI